MTKNLKNDLCDLTGVSVESVDKILNLCEDTICHCVFEDIKSKESLTQVDIGIGTLYIRQDGELLKYKFIPSDALDNKVKKTCRTKESPLIKRATKSLRLKFDRAYKELI